MSDIHIPYNSVATKSPITVPKNHKLRSFCPIVLFHEHTYKTETIEECVRINTGDEYHGEFIRSWKKRVEKMLETNSRDWLIIAENSRFEEQLLCGREQMITQSPTIQIANSIYSHNPHNPCSQDQIDMKPKRRRGNLPKAVTALLKDWLAKHKKHPYPTEEEKLLLSKETKLSLQQISNWFINARRRHLPHLLESEAGAMNNSSSQSSQNSPELDIYSYEASESAEDSDNRLRCSSGRVNHKTGGIKKPKQFTMQQKRKAVSVV